MSTAVKPVGRELPAGVRDDRSADLCEPADVVSCGDGNAAAGYSVVGVISLLHSAQVVLVWVAVGTHHNRQGKIADFKNPCGIWQGDARGVDGGERIAKLDIFRGGDVNIPGAGANDFITRPAIRCRAGYANGVGSLAVLADRGICPRGGGVWNGGIKFSHENRSLADKRGCRRNFAVAGGSQVGSGSHSVAPRLEIYRKICVERFRGCQPHRGVSCIGCDGYRIKAVAQGVVKNQIARRTKGQDAWSRFGSVSEVGEIPVGSRERLDIGGSRI